MSNPHPPPDRLQSLRSLLLALPCWRSAPERRSLIEFALHQHPILNQLRLDADPATAAADLALQLINLADDPSTEGHPDHTGTSGLQRLFDEIRTRRYDSNRIVAEHLRRLDPGQRPEICPYPGLVAYDWGRNRDTARLYFGREPEVDELIERLREQRQTHFHLVTGASGCGKSSLVKAGLWRRLEDPGAGDEPIAGCRGWLITAMVPNIDGDAFLTLVGSLRDQSPVRLRSRAESQRLIDDAREQRLDAFAALLPRVLGQRQRWLLLLDQMEELFAPEANDYREAFAWFLVHAVADPRFCVVATLRCDFLHRIVEHPALCKLLRSGSQTYLSAPGRTTLERMIVEPARVTGLSIERPLVDRLVDDADRECGGLALLAATLQDLCSGALADGRLTLTHYEQGIGGLAGVLTRRGERGLKLMQAEGIGRETAKAVVRRVFGKLLNVTADGERTTRRRAPRSGWPDDSLEQHMIQVFCQDADDPQDAVRLLVCSESGNHPTIEIAHEALFDKWPPLATWIETQREALVRRNEALRGAAAWQHGGRADHHLPNPVLVDEIHQRLQQAGLWDDIHHDLSLARYLARDDAAELKALIEAEYQAARTGTGPARATREAARLAAHLSLINRQWSITRQLGDWLNAEAPDIAAWLRHGTVAVFRLLRRRTTPEWQQRRLGIGNWLAVLGDQRRGIGLRPDGLPDIDWVAIPAGELLWQDQTPVTLDGFAIARYPITNQQYAAFIDAPDYGDGRWWRQLAAGGAPRPSRWPQPNRPRTNLSWAETVAFCRWLTVRLREAGSLTAGQRLRLPTEYQWERAVRGARGHAYPWGPDYRSGHANVNETDSTHQGRGQALALGETSAVGFYPLGQSRFGLHDCIGNVWEWCLNKYADPSDLDPAGDAQRTLRGGSWNHDRRLAVSTFRRHDFSPLSRYRSVGFRVVLVDEE